MRSSQLEPSRRRQLTTIPLLILLSAAATLRAQSPFQFREAYLLERRMAPSRGDLITLTHFEENLGRVKPTYVQNGDCIIPGCQGPDGKPVLDLNNPTLYQTGRWVALLEQTDKDRREGAYAVAGPVYLQMIDMLRKTAGQNSNEVALMLDHLAEYYLEGRDFAKAYQTFEQAIQVRRATITLTGPIPEDTTDRAVLRQVSYQAHLADMLARLGQIDMGHGDLARAQQRLTESVAIFNRKLTRRLVGSLYAVYFDSLALERQGKWKEAEDLWKQSVALREDIALSNPYWDCLREQAAFYARRGDFHTAAIIAQKVQDGTKGKQFKTAAPMPYFIDSRPRGENGGGPYGLYTQESDTALKEILALDKWQTSTPAEGTAAATALLPNPYAVTNRPLYDFGADSELAQMLAWVQQRVFLHMSILLDGQPTQQQVETAYQLLAQVKGRYLASIGATTAYAEYGRNNPGIDTDTLPIMDELGETREYQAQIYLDTALDKKPFRAVEFGNAENVQRILSRSLSSDASVSSLGEVYTLKSLQQNVPDDAAMVDFVLWDRLDRNPKVPPHREYGAFVFRKGQPVRYVRIGAAETIDKQVDALKAGVLSNHTRGFLVETQTPPVSPDIVAQRLKALYTAVMAPLEPAVQGAKQLFIVPDGKLTLAPLSGLIDGSGHYVFETRTISYLNSWRDLDPSVIPDTDTAPTAVVVANPDFNLLIPPTPKDAASSKRPTFVPLPGAELEARDIQAALKIPASRVLIGPASRKWLIQSVTSPQILHFATHTVPSLEFKPPVAEYNLFDVPQPQISQNPLLQSMIAMAGANRPQTGAEDGILTGLEVSRLHLTGTSIVVLSTCESGQGTPVEGLGVLGLRAAFSMAGAHALVMTLWPVDDAAGRQFMKFFYSHLQLGTAAALRQAQLDMVALPQYKNPFYWSGYVVSGGPEIRRKDLVETAKADPALGKETFLTPHCIELFMSAKDGNEVIYRTTRVKLGGVVYKTQDSADQVTYDLRNPGNSITIRTSDSTNGGPRQNPEVRGEGRQSYTGTLTIKNNKDMSAMYLRFGRADTEPEERELITLQGSSGLFADLRILDNMPLPSLFKVATDSAATGFKLDRAKACTPVPSW